MDDHWITLCRRRVPEVLCQRDWRLVPEDDLPRFVEKVKRAIADGTINQSLCASSDDAIRRATIHLYCHELYQASGENGTMRQQRAFEELGRHAQGVAFRYESDGGVVQICAQRALVIAWEKRSQVRSPGSFLRWIEQIVYFEIKKYWREQQRERDIPMSQLVRADTNGSGDPAFDHVWGRLASMPPPDDEIVNRELRETLWMEVRRAFGNNERYAAVIIGLFLYELSTLEMAKLLDTSPSNIHLLKHRALKQLRCKETFLARFADALEGLNLSGDEP